MKVKLLRPAAARAVSQAQQSAAEQEECAGLRGSGLVADEIQFHAVRVVDNVEVAVAVVQAVGRPKDPANSSAGGQEGEDLAVGWNERVDQADVQDRKS